MRHYVERIGMDFSGASDVNELAVSYRDHNAVRWFSAANGKQVAEASVPEPVAVAAMADGTALVISQGAVVAVPRDGSKPRIVIPAEQLQNSWRLCVSPASGDIFVAENSGLARGSIKRPEKDFNSGEAQDLSVARLIKNAASGQHHQVKRFSSTGKPLAAFGKPEGRQDGVYISTDFRGGKGATHCCERADGETSFRRMGIAQAGSMNTLWLVRGPWSQARSRRGASRARLAGEPAAHRIEAQS